MTEPRKFDCIVCGEHFEDERSLQHHSSEAHTTMGASGGTSRAEPTDEERAESSTDKKQPNASTRDGSATPRFGSAGGGGAEFEPGPKRN